MSQPFNRGCQVPAPGMPDASLKEFWVNDPWKIGKDNNLSCYERNRAYLNVHGEDFLDVSFLTSADSDGDGRCAVGADLDNDGRVDLLVRQVGGGPLLVLQNQFQQKHWLKVTLRGTKSNRLGVGTRLNAVVAGRQIVRDQFPVNSYHSQAPSLVHFGLGDADRVDSLTLRWPSGAVQTFENLPADQHIVLEEGSDQFEVFQPGQVLPP